MCGYGRVPLFALEKWIIMEVMIHEMARPQGQAAARNAAQDSERSVLE
jgi:hypothetical protein